ncbi:hypothetical protein ACEWY4_017314 [Coilia grayii]|uniref:Immunoglobulin domain-containing protein n=1 Tax=Coilia grayii TaxID=363190 RepID=A0ABD1JGG7_9TELE
MRLYLIISCVLSVLGGVKAEPISVTATEGDNADIHCSAALAHGNDKYFCKDPCEDDHHVLVATKKHAQPPGKYSLVDHGNGSFTVTIYHVEFNDSGTYYCGVDRFLKDTFTKVILDVIARPTQPDHRLTSVYTPLTAPPANTDYDYDSDYDKEDVDDGTDPPIRSSPSPRSNKKNESKGSLVYIGVGLAVMVFVLVLFLVTLHRTTGRKRRESAAAPTGHASTAGRGNNQQVLCNYAEVTIAPGNKANTGTRYSQQVQCDYADIIPAKRSSVRAPVTSDSSAIYSNVPPQLSNQKCRSVASGEEESLQYATVRFTEPTPGGANAQGSSVGSGREGVVIYSTVNLQ